MSRSSAARERIRALEGKRAKLAREAAGLIQDQQRLLLQNAILHAWCEALTLLQVHWGGSGMACETSLPEDPQQAEGVRQRFRELLNHEVRLLDELTVRESIASCSVSEAAAVLPDSGPDAVSPGDPMHYFRAAIAECPSPEAAHMTSADLAALLRETVLMSSLRLQQGHTPAAPTLTPARAASQLWDRYYRVLLSLTMLGREHVVHGIFMYDLQTLLPAQEHAEASEQVVASLPAHLNLTEVQKDIISVVADVCVRLAQSLKKQQEEVLEQLEAAGTAADATADATADTSGAAAAAAADGGGGSSSGRQQGPLQGVDPSGSVSGGQDTAAASPAASPAAAAAAACDAQCPSSSGGSAGCPPARLNSTSFESLGGLGSRQQHLEKQQQLAARLKLLMGKQYMLIVTMVGLTVGCLSYCQLSLTAVLGWPCVVPMHQLAMEIGKMRQLELMQSPRQSPRQQQQQQAHLQRNHVEQQQQQQEQQSPHSQFQQQQQQQSQSAEGHLQQQELCQPPEALQQQQQQQQYEEAGPVLASFSTDHDMSDGF